MTDPRSLTQPQRDMLLDLACLPPGRWSPLSAGDVTARSLTRRGLIEMRATPVRAVGERERQQVRLAHNSAARRATFSRRGGAPV